VHLFQSSRREGNERERKGKRERERAKDYTTYQTISLEAEDRATMTRNIHDNSTRCFHAEEIIAKKIIIIEKSVICINECNMNGEASVKRITSARVIHFVSGWTLKRSLFH